MAEVTEKTAKTNGSKSVINEGDIEAQLEAIRADVTALSPMMGAIFKEKVHEFEATAGAAAEEANAKAKKARKYLEDSVDQAEKALDNRVQDNPLQSIAMAFGLGVLVAYLFRR